MSDIVRGPSEEELTLIESFLPGAYGANIEIDRETGLVIVTAQDEDPEELFMDNICSLLSENLLEMLNPFSAEEKEYNNEYYLPNSDGTRGTVLKQGQNKLIAESNLAFGVRSDEHIHGADLLIHLGALLRQMGDMGRIVGIENMRFYKPIAEQPIVVFSANELPQRTDELLAGGTLHTTAGTQWHFGYYEGTNSIEEFAGVYRHIQFLNSEDPEVYSFHEQKKVHSFVLPEMDSDKLSELIEDTAGGLAASALLEYMNEGMVQLRKQDFFCSAGRSSNMLIASYDQLHMENPDISFMGKDAIMEFVLDKNDAKQTATSTLYPVSFAFKDSKGVVRAEGRLMLAVIVD